MKVWDRKRENSIIYIFLIIHIEEELNEINSELHEVRPEYTEKLKRIDRGKFLTRRVCLILQ